MFELLKTYKHYDPAAKSKLEILFLYPGIKAIFLHRVAHFLFGLRLFFLARLVAEMSRFLTGIEIHPGATLGRNVIFDHGMGTVIGETAVIGDGVILYQGVTLGGTDLKPSKRHPTIEPHVVIGAGAKILGNITIGEGSRVGSNSVVVINVPPHSTVVGIPGHIIHKGVSQGEELRHDKITD